MKALTKVCSGVLMAIGMAYNAHAILITAGTTASVATGNETSTSTILGIIQAAPYNVGPELYKQDVGGGEGGSLAGSYTATFSNTTSDPEDALIKYNGGAVAGPTAFLLVKDGNSTPAWYLFNLTTLGWTGIEDIILQDFWVGKGAISHVSIYGGTGTVPDAGSMLVLLGGAVTALGFLRRKISA